jgi:hypothetical protein
MHKAFTKNGMRHTNITKKFQTSQINTNLKEPGYKEGKSADRGQDMEIKINGSQVKIQKELSNDQTFFGDLVINVKDPAKKTQICSFTLNKNKNCESKEENNLINESQSKSKEKKNESKLKLVGCVNIKMIQKDDKICYELLMKTLNNSGYQIRDNSGVLMNLKNKNLNNNFEENPQISTNIVRKRSILKKRIIEDMDNEKKRDFLKRIKKENVNGKKGVNLSINFQNLK